LNKKRLFSFMNCFWHRLDFLESCLILSFSYTLGWNALWKMHSLLFSCTYQSFSEVFFIFLDSNR
jgi:hypothetical protein